MSIADIVYLTGEVVDQTLPRPDGGNTPIVYSLTPALPPGLTFVIGLDPATITGTVGANAIASVDYTLTAADSDPTGGAGDEDTLMFSITVEEDTAPAFATNASIPALASYPRGAAITPLTFPEATGGNGDLTYALTSTGAMPAGLTFNGDARPPTLTGTPAFAGSVIYSYTVTDADDNTVGTDSAVLTFTFVATASATTLNFPSSTHTLYYPLGAPITPTTFPAATAGTAPLTYAVVSGGMPPAGLTFDSTNRILSGTPSAAGSSSFTYRVTDSATPTPDNDLLETTIVICESGGMADGGTTCTPPAFVTLVLPAVAEQAFQQILPITTPVTLPEATGGSGASPVRIYTLTPLPAGLAFDPATRAISGRPEAVGTTTVNYRVGDAGAGNADTQSTTVMFDIVVFGRPLLPAPGSVVYAVGDTVALTLTTGQRGTPPYTYALSTQGTGGALTLPAGLTFNGDPRPPTITGMPTAVTALLRYSYEVTDSRGVTNSSTFSITVNAAADIAPDFDTATVPDQFYTVGTAIPDLTLPEVATPGNGATTYILTAPPGLNFDPSTRVLSGTPTTAAGVTTYTYTARDEDESPDTLAILITVNAAAPVANTAPAFVAGASIGAETYYQDTDITPLTLPRATGGEGAITYALTPAIPGMFFDTVTGVLSGAPTTEAAATDYTYTAGDTDGSAPGTDESSLTISITVLANTIPTFSIIRGPSYIYTVGTVVNETLPAATGGDGTLVYTLSRVAFLPDGLTFDAAATPPTITGTPTTAARRATYRYNVDDSDANEAAGDGSSLSFRITIRGAPATGITMTIRDLAGDPITSLNEGDDPTTFRLHFDTVPALSGFTADQDVAITVSTPVAGQVGYTAAGRSDFIDRDVASESSGQLQLTVTDDDVATADGVVTYTATVSPSGFTATAMITLVDNEISIVTTPAAVTLATGSTADYTVQLDQEPPGSVTVSVVSVGDAIATVSRNTRVFTAANWNVPASVTVTGMRGGSTTISHSATAAGGFGYQSTDVMVTVTPVAVNFPAGTLVLDQTFQVGTAVDLTLPTATGATTYRLSSHADQSLPAGLTFDGATRVLSGIPTAAQVAEGYVYSARNPDNLDNLNFDITVEATGTPTTPPTSQTLSLNPTAVTESATPTDITATVTLTGGAYNVARLFSIGSSSGTATEGTDYTALSNVVLTIPANLASGTVTFPFTAADDMVVEGGGEALNIRSTLLIVAGTDPDTSLAVANAIISISDPAAADTAPSFGTTTIMDQTFTVGTAVDMTLPEATGGEDGIVYTLSTALPAGLTFNSGTRVLDGTPTAVATAATYFYRAADGDGNNMPSDSVLLTFTITVSADTAPAFAGSAAIEAQTYAALTEITPLTLPTATGGNGDITYTLTPAIPGLTLDAATGVLTGTPTTEATATMYTYTAADADGNTVAGDEVSLTFSLTVTEAIPTGVVLSVNPTMVMESATPTAVMLTATVTGGTFNVERVVRWRINDGTASQFSDYTRIGNTDLTIPANMVSGTATFMFTAHVDTVAEPDGETVRIEGGVLNLARNGTDSSLSLTPAILTINDGTDTGTAPTSQTVTISPTAVTESADPTDIMATVTLNGGVFSVARAFRIEARGGTATAMEVDYRSIDNTILTIPANTASASVTFEFTAVVDTDTDSGETVMIRSTLLDFSENAADPTVPFVSATLTINDAPAGGPDTSPTFGDVVIAAQVYSVGTAVNLTLPAATGGNGVITYSLTPTALAAGLSFNAATRVLAGTPNTQASPTTYTYTAADEDSDTASLMFAISVGAAGVDSAPAFADGAAITAQTYMVNTAITPLTLPTATGGNGDITYTLTPAIPGLTLDAATGILSGTPTTEAVATDYTYTAGDSDGSAAGTDEVSLMFSITVMRADPTRIDLSVNPAAVTESTTATTITVTATLIGGTFAAERIVTFDTSDGTATAPDYTAVPFIHLTIPENTASGTATFMFTANVDTDAEPGGETVILGGELLDTAMMPDDSIPVTPATLTINDYTPVTVNAGIDRSVAYGTTITLNGEVTSSTDAVVVITWALVESSAGATAAALVTAGVSMGDAATEVTRLTTALALLRTPIATLDAPAADLGLTGPVEITLSLTVADSNAPAGQPASATMVTDEVVITVVGPDEAPVFTNLPSGMGTTPMDAIEFQVAVNSQSVDFPNFFGATMGIGGDPATVTLSGPDVSFFTLTTDGTLTFDAPSTMDGSDANGDNIYELTLTANPVVFITVRVVPNATPAFAAGASIPDQPYAPDTVITPLTLPEATGGNAPLRYTLTPALPAGLIFTAADRTITGTPTAETATTEYTWTAMDVDGSTAALTFSITVREPDMDLTPVVEQWLARFGRSVATQAVDTIGDRMTGVSSPGSQLTLGGRQFSLNDLARGYASPGAGAGWAGSHQPVGSHQPALTGSLQPVGSHQPVGNQPAAAGAMPADFALTQRTRSMSFSEVMQGSNFDLALSGGASDEGSKPLTLWGRVSTGSFDARPTGMSLKGDLVTGYLGLDYHSGRTLLGFAISRTEGEGDFRLEDRAGKLETTLTSVYPYLRWSLSDGLDVWGMLGSGGGELEYSLDSVTDGSKPKTDIEMRMAALGLRGTLPSAGLVDLAIKTDLLIVQTQSDAARSSLHGTLNDTDASVRRLRLMLEASSNWPLSEHATIIPSLELGVRWDEGDADTGLGTELGGGFTYRHSRLGLELAARARVLLNHEESGFEEWGASLSFRKTVGPDGQGLAFALTPTWGQASSGVDSLWSSEPAGLLSRGLTRGSTSATPDQLEFELSWGMLRPGGLLTPYMQMRMAQGRMDSFREGLRLQLPRGVSLEVFGEHNLQPGQPADHGIGLTGRIDL